jgi:hypothetical protein
MNDRTQAIPKARERATRRRGFTLAEAVIASGFVGVTLAGILSMAPALIRGQRDIVDRSLAAVAATEMLGMFDRGEVSGMTPEQIPTATAVQQSGLISALLGSLLTPLQPNSPSGQARTPIRQFQQQINGFDVTLRFDPVDPLSLDISQAEQPAALISVEVRRSGKVLHRLNVIRTDAWSQADVWREFDE